VVQLFQEFSRPLSILPAPIRLTSEEGKRHQETVMACPHKDPQTLKSLAGSVLVGPGLFILFGHLVWAVTQLSRLGMLSSIILAASFGQHQLLHVVLRVFWPLLLVIVGAVLLGTVSPDNAKTTARA
jgi:cation transporter-like permease